MMMIGNLQSDSQPKIDGERCVESKDVPLELLSKSFTAGFIFRKFGAVVLGVSFGYHTDKKGTYL
jgi:hypothetical protein